MYQYIFDHFLSQKKYDKTVSKIEAKITDLDIKGKINKLSLLKNLETYVREINDKKSEVFVVVGDDKTIIKIINAVVENGLILGIIPVGKNQKIAELLGIPMGEKACEVLAARRVEEFALGKVGGHVFLRSVEFFGQGAGFFCDNKFEIKATKQNEKIGLYNCSFGVGDRLNRTTKRNGRLELVSSPKEQNIFWKKKNISQSSSHIWVKKAKIVAEQDTASVLIDGEKIIKTPVEVGLAEKALRVIVGKSKVF